MSARVFRTFRDYLKALKRDPGLGEFDTTAAEGAREIGVSRSVIGNWVVRGKIPAVRAGTKICLVRMKDLRDTV